MNRTTITAIALLGAASMSATAASAKDDTQYWQAVTVNKDLGDGFQVSNEIVLRTSDRRGFYEVENNLMIGKALNKHVTVFVGYTHDPQYSHGDFTVMERRARQQVNFDKYKLGNVEVSGRLRMEERFRDGIDGTGWRLRPYAKLALPVAKGSKTKVVFTNEAFINFNTTSFQKQSGWDRTRSFIGLSTPLLKNVTVEGGYLLQHGYVRNGPDTNDHVFNVSLSAKF